MFFLYDFVERDLFVPLELKNNCIRKNTGLKNYKFFFIEKIKSKYPVVKNSGKITEFGNAFLFFLHERKNIKNFKPSKYTKYIKEQRQKYMNLLIALNMMKHHIIFNVCDKKKRPERIKLRFTEDEFAFVKERAKMYGLSITELLYFSASNVTVNRFDDKLVLSYIKELKKSVNYLYVELNRIAINRDEYTSFFEDKKHLKNLLDAIIQVKEI